MMNHREQKVVRYFEKFPHVIENREIFYVLQNDEPSITQDETDDVLAKLVSEKKIDKRRLRPDSGIFKFNKHLDEIMRD